MPLVIKRFKDNRVVKCVLHRVADIPGGVTVSTSELGGTALFEGTPLGVGENGLYKVCKTAQIITEATADATSYEVAKGHHFQVGDLFATESCNGKAIASIDKSDASKDVITLASSLGAVVKAGTCAFESAGANKTLKVIPVAVAGSNNDVTADGNLFVDAFVMAVVKKASAPIVSTAIETALKGVIYV